MQRAYISAVVVAFATVGCFSPKPPAGSYLCSASDNECPSGQQCVCGLCVDRESQAACGFRIETTAPANATLDVSEHQSFAITVKALDGSGNAASEFAGEVTLASTWGDVRPNKVKLQNGAATVDVKLNRETLPPQTASILASFYGGNTGKSGKISVSVARFVRETEPVIPPASKLRPFGWANFLVAQPNVLRDANGGYRMYFVGVAESTPDASSIGIATSPDGKTWTPQAQPVITGGSSGGGGFGIDVASPSVFKVGEKFHAVVSKGGANGREIALGMSNDGLTGWSIYNNAMAVLKPSDCGYCNQDVDFPQALPDPLSLDANGKPTAWVMFFNATSSNSSGFNSVAIGRAQSSDGLTFTPEPAPLLSGDLTGEAILYSPRILVDGTVYKMWYSFARVGEISALFDLCDVNTKTNVGYATSDDGFYWIRSPSNPVLEPSDGGWDKGDRTTLVSSVVPTDGVDPANGIELYYTTFRRQLLQCLPNGIGKATRP